MTAYYWATFLSTLFDASIGALVLFARGPHGRPGESTAPPITATRLGVALGATAACFSAKLLLWRIAGLNAFGLMRLVYLDLVIGLPRLGIAILIASRMRRVVVPVRGAAWLACAMIPIGIYASYIEPFRLRFERHTVPVRAERAGRSPLRIGVLADIQTDRVTDFERSAVDRLMAERPDLILLPGDLHLPTGAAAPVLRGLPAPRSRGLRDPGAPPQVQLELIPSLGTRRRGTRGPGPDQAANPLISLGIVSASARPGPGEPRIGVRQSRAASALDYRTMRNHDP